MRATILAVVLTALLSACGQKGPLASPVPPVVEQSKAPAKSGDRPFPDVPATSEQK
ncbi:MAG: LPS translocon maturation chaperone LptM [Burkholderiaceae bacterium]